MGVLLIPVRVFASVSRASTPAMLNSEDRVNAWLRSIEREAGVGIDGKTGLCKATRKPYQEMLWNPDGTFADLSGREFWGGVAVRLGTPEMAWASFATGFWQYREQRSGKIHWRHRPEMTEHEGTFCVYARAFLEKT